MDRLLLLSYIRAATCFLGLCLLPVTGTLSAGGCTSVRVGSLEENPPLPTAGLLQQWQRVSAESGEAHHGLLTLDQAIEEALRGSPELEQIRQRVAAAGQQVRLADASFYPRLVVAEDFNVTDNPVFALMNIINQRRLQSDVNFNNPGEQHNFSTQIRGEWSLFEGGSRWYKRKALLDQHRSMEADLLAARNSMVAEVSKTYYRWLQALDFIGVAEKALESAKTDERLGEARVRAETALPSELLRLKARAAEVHGNLVMARTAARRLQAAMERLLARTISPEEIPQGTVSISPATLESLAEDPHSLVEQALDKRPELSAVRSLILAARRRVRSAQGGFLPSLGTQARYQWDSEDFSDSADSWLVGVQATWTLFEGGTTLAAISEARVRLKEMEARGQQVALDIALEVHQATLAVQEAAERIRVAAERKKYAQSALEEVRNLYRNQVVLVDALLQAEVAWNQAEVSYTSALFEGKIAQALLRQSLGEFAQWMGMAHE